MAMQHIHIAESRDSRRGFHPCCWRLPKIKLSSFRIHLWTVDIWCLLRMIIILRTNCVTRGFLIVRHIVRAAWCWARSPRVHNCNFIYLPAQRRSVDDEYCSCHELGQSGASARPGAVLVWSTLNSPPRLFVGAGRDPSTVHHQQVSSQSQGR